MSAAIGASELSLVLLLLCAVVVPIAAFAFYKSGKGLEDLGKGTFAINREEPGQPGTAPVETPKGERDEEVRQMVEASNFRRRERGEAELEVEAEIDRLLRGDFPSGDPRDPRGDPADEDGPAGGDSLIKQEIRQLVVANNERRERRGEEPLDVETEVEKRLREWT